MSYIWEGVYSDFTEAIGTGIGFGGNDWIANSVRNLNRLRSDTLNCNGPAAAPAYAEGLLPVIAATLLAERGRFRILDFGGGLGVGFIKAKACLPKDGFLEYFVWDVPEVCEEGKRQFSDNSEISFHSKLPQFNSPPDLVNFGSSISYVNDWHGLIGQMAGLDAQYLLFRDLPAGNIPTFVSLQNYYESKIPYWFFNYSEFVSKVSASGYTLSFQARYLPSIMGKSEEYPQDNFPVEYRLGYPCILLFHRERERS